MDNVKQANGDSVGVVLFQLGGPDSLEAIEPFLFNLFSDPDIIDFPFARLARPTLARLISSRRARKVHEHYANIGGNSPIRALTERQAEALERKLRKTLNARVFVAMRYWHPLTEEAARQVAAHSFREVVLLPLYPQYSRTTTGSSLNEWHRRYRPSGLKQVPVKIIRQFYTLPSYIEAVVEKVNQGLERFGGLACPEIADLRTSAPASERFGSLVGPRGTHEGAEAPTRDCREGAHTARLKPSPDGAPAGGDSMGVGVVHLVFSAHGVPISVIEAGDPYRAQLEATVRLVMEKGGWSYPHRVCYQSRVGPGRWLRPSFDEALHSLAAEGAENVLVIPISFVSDHVETLSEIDIEARQVARQLGIRQFEVMPALNDSPKFIQALADLVFNEVRDGIPAGR